jgi:VIT1/CCC1 family predicted Fe2+/Mn2+ transporter
MPEHAIWLPHRLLDPRDRISEILFGLIMALTITNSLGIAQHGEGDIRALLAGALGCNIAWGLIDAAMYMMAELSDRGRAILTLRRFRNAADAPAARQVIADALPPLLASVLQEGDLDTMRQRLSGLPAPPDKPALAADDWLAAVGVFLLVFLSTLPVVVPFVFIDEARLALRISNGIAIAMLFLCGYALGRHSGQHPWGLGLAMVVVGIALTGMAILLGG